MIVGMVAFHGNVALSVTLLNVANLLSEQGHEVHLFHNRRWEWRGKRPDELHAAVRVHYFDTQTQAYQHSWQNLLDLAHVAHYVRLQASYYDVIIGVDQEGVIAAWLVKCLRHANKLVYLSLEIILQADYAHKGRYFAIKHWLEQRALRAASQLWIQDALRGRALVEDLRTPHFPLTILPHAPRGVRDPALPKPTYLRDKYGIPTSTTIVIYTGGVNPEYRTFQLAQMAAQAADWPAQAVLVMHGFGREEHVQYLRSLHNARFIFSDELLSMQGLDDMLASADIGIALFDPTIDANYRLMASGKIMHYLKMGLPVIATKTVTTQAILERWEAGICVDDAALVPTAYAQLLRHYADYAEAALRAFASAYEFERNFWPAWQALTAMRN